MKTKNKRADDIELPDDDELDNESITEEDNEPNESLDNSNENQLQAKNALPEHTKIEDIFEDVGKPAFMEGDLVKYYIKRNGYNVGEEQEPFSMQKLQEKYGPGMYLVVARSTKRGRIIGRQPIPIGDAVKEPPKPEDKISDPLTKAVMSMTQQSQNNNINDPPTKQPGLVEMMGLISEAQSKAKKEATETSSTMMEMFMQSQRQMMELLTRQSPQSQSGGNGGEIKIVMESVEMLGRMMKQNMEFQANMMADLMKQIRENQSQGRGTINDPEKIFSLMMNTKKSALEEFHMMEELAEKKAKLLAGISDDDQEDESTLESTIKTFLPIIGKAIAPNAEALPQAQPNLPVATAQPRGELRTREFVRESYPTGNRTDRPSHAPSQAYPQSQSRLPINQKTVVTMPKGTPTMAAFTKDKCISILGSKLATWLMSHTDPKIAATEAVTKLKEQGHTVKEAMTVFPTAESLLATAHTYRIPSVADSWLNQWYGHIRAYLEPEKPATGTDIKSGS